MSHIDDNIAATSAAKSVSFVWYTVTCVAGAVVSFGSYVGGLYTQDEAKMLESRLGQRIERLESHQEIQTQQLVEIAKTVGAKMVLPTSAPTSQSTK